jgi:hypothetical protein
MQLELASVFGALMTTPDSSVPWIVTLFCTVTCSV